MKFKWVCNSDDGYFEDSLEDHNRTFDSQRECYESMREAAIRKLFWNTTYNDVTNDCDPYLEDGIEKTSGEMVPSFNADVSNNDAVGYKVEFHPNMIQHYSYSGLYTYKIVVVEDDSAVVDMTDEVAEENGVVAANCCRWCKNCNRDGERPVCKTLNCYTFDTDECLHFEHK